MGRVRLTLRLLALAAALAAALLLHGGWRLARRRSPWPRLWLRAVAWIVGARVRCEGEPRRHTVVLLANHLSWIDIPLLAGTTGAAFVAKAELAGVPLVGWLCRLNHTLFVSRDDRLGIARQVDRLRGALSRDWPVAIFPEGTTGDGRALLPFKAALLAALDPAPPGLLVQPVRIDYGGETEELAWTGEESGLDHARRVLGRRGRFTATLRFLPPFAPADHPGRKAIAAEARRRIVAAAGETGAGPV